jgi:hypothetical protein
MKRMLIQSRTYWYTLIILALTSTASHGKGPLEDAIRRVRLEDYGGAMGDLLAVVILLLIVALIRWPFNRLPKVKPKGPE